MLLASSSTLVLTRHRMCCNGQDFAYTATVGETVVPGLDDRPGVTLWSFVYTKDYEDPAAHPVIFVSNGAPSGSSIYTHMIGFGPIRAELPDRSAGASVSYRTVSNDNSLLDVADLVFIDSPGTGFARPLHGARPDDFWEVNRDRSRN
jgi:carboxypeptidase C (cathepsin A)